MGAPDTGQILFDGRHLRARIFQPGQKRLFVSFDSFRPKRAGFDDRGPVQFYLNAGWSQLQIQTSANDWYLNDDLEPLRLVLAQAVQPYRRVSSMAFSMGAYGALLMSRALRLTHVFLVSPQITPFSQRGPKDGRYRGFEAGMRGDLDLGPKDLQDRMRGFVLFDPLQRSKDREHARAVEALVPGIVAVAMPMAGHPADKTILQGRLWPEFQALLMDKACRASQIKQLHRSGRQQAQTYQDSLSERLLARAQRQAAAGGGGNSLP